MVLVNGFDAWVQTPNGNYAISSQRYAPDAVYPDGAWHIQSFDADPWPRWRFRLDDGTVVEQEIFVPRGAPAVRALIARYAGATPESLQIVAGPHGKPMLANGLSPGGAPLRFNLSHSGGTTLLAFALGVEVGIDIEHAREAARESRLRGGGDGTFPGQQHGGLLRPWRCGSSC